MIHPVAAEIATTTERAGRFIPQQACAIWTHHAGIKINQFTVIGTVALGGADTVRSMAVVAR